jgi:hypothetical protein
MTRQARIADALPTRSRDVILCVRGSVTRDGTVGSYTAPMAVSAADDVAAIDDKEGV